MQPSMWGNSGQNVFFPIPGAPWKENFADVRANALNRLWDRSLVTPENGSSRRIFSLLLSLRRRRSLGTPDRKKERESTGLTIRSNQLLQGRIPAISSSARLARFTVELQARRGLLSFSRGEKVAGTAG